MTRRGSLSALAAVATAVAVVGTVAPQAVAAPGSKAVRAAAARKIPAGLALARQQAVIQTRNGRFGPYGPDPAKALVSDPNKVDWGGWRRQHLKESEQLAKARHATAARAGFSAPAPRFVREDEPAGTKGANDSFRTAQSVPGFGTRKGTYPAVTVLGRLSPDPVPPLETVAPPATDPGDTLETAFDTGVARVRQGIRTSAVIGDNPPDPQNPGGEDADLYKFTLRAGQELNFTVKRTSGNLIPATVLLDSEGNLVAFGEDDVESTSTLSQYVRSSGTYYVVVIGYTVINIGGGGPSGPTTGGYSVDAYARAGDRDLYKVSLQAGDVLGVNVTDAARYVSVFDAKGVEVHGSGQDASSAYPPANPLPGGGNAVTDHVVRRAGTFYVEVTAGSGAYQAQLEVYRYGGSAKKQTQTIYLDTDGQRLNTNVVYGRGVTTLSPLRSFLGGWGLARSQEKALIGKIKATVQENLDTDLRRSGLSKYVSVKVVTSLDGPDPFGKPGVTRVIVGGTIEESGVYTIGIAQSIDPGNYERNETALVLLDILSQKAKPGDDNIASLNHYINARSNRLAFVGRAVGNVVSHEVGHMIGNWHTDNGDRVANLMDAGGQNFGLLFGVGRDNIGGTRDDVDVDFVTDRFDPYEGFTGVEDTQARSTWAMSTRP